MLQQQQQQHILLGVNLLIDKYFIIVKLNEYKIPTINKLNFLSFHPQQAKETLLDPAKRANYDKWRNSGINISYKNWLGMKEHVHQVKKYVYTHKYYNQK